MPIFISKADSCQDPEDITETDKQIRQEDAEGMSCATPLLLPGLAAGAWAHLPLVPTSSQYKRKMDQLAIRAAE